jgi:hypothetical protein
MRPTNDPAPEDDADGDPTDGNGETSPVQDIDRTDDWEDWEDEEKP